MQRRGVAVLAVAALLVVGVVGGIGLRTDRARAATAAFDKNLIISNALFDASTAMDATQIQQFLNRYPNSCLRNYQAPLPTGYSTYGGKVSAAKVIEAAARLWGTNPQVLLVTLEKEQSLVTGGVGCASWRYWSAMGYGCPDGGARYDYPALGITGTCVMYESWAGFAAQVNRGSWQLQFNRQRAEGNLNWKGFQSTTNYGYNTPGWRQASAGAPSRYEDGWATIDGQAVFMTNGATASLYTYTPHLSANQAFSSLFTSWFGSTGPPPTTPPVTTVPRLSLEGPEAAYVDSLYRVFVGRPATVGEKTIWLTSFSSGASTSTAVTHLLASMEYSRYEIARDYVLILHRAPDPGGHDAWSATLAGNGRNDLVLASFAGSDEYYRSRSKSDDATFVTNLYQDFLGRNVDATGFAHWTAILTDGSMSRTTVARAILDSGEYRTKLVDETYRRVLGRAADPAGVDHWGRVFQSTRRVSDVQSGLAKSSEGFSYLSSLR